MNIFFNFTFQMDLSLNVLSQLYCGSYKVYLNFWVTHFSGCDTDRVIKINIFMFGWDCPSPLKSGCESRRETGPRNASETPTLNTTIVSKHLNSYYGQYSRDDTQTWDYVRNATTVPFRPSVQSRVTAEKTDRFKIRLNSKENLSAFSETKS